MTGTQDRPAVEAGPPSLLIAVFSTPDESPRPWVAIQRNRRSGAGRQHGPIMELIRALRSEGIEPRLYSSRVALDAAVRSRRPDQLLAIVAAGGDGTVLDLVNRHPTLPIAPLPLGTENLVARELGIPRRDGSFVARMIATGRRLAVDLGRIETAATGSAAGRFCIMLSCGFDAEVIRRAHEARRGHITRCHYLRPIAATLVGYRFPEVRVFVDDNPEPLVGGLAVVANLSRYALGLPLVPTARPDDGLLHVRVFPHRSRLQLLRDLSRVVLGSSERASGVQRAVGTRIRIESDSPLPVQADGDPAGCTPVELTIEPSAGTLVVP
ncbi:MAG: diacylglycerol kinase family protein [Planctomycetaceae bacterium]